MEYSETEYDSEDSSGSEYLLGSESENEFEELTPMKRRKLTRKRKRNPENWKKNIRKIKLQRGEEYISNTGAKDIICWTDSCVPQNRNSLISSAVASFLQDNDRIQSITLKCSTPGHSCIQELHDLPLEEELETSDLTLNSNKAPGPDGIPSEALKKIFTISAGLLLRMYNACLVEGVFPSL
ncbi:hypothetical protein J6590_093608 [Homalodisca vitripennis]|nr:hypothetical protein J6590_093608 [Homalodisca vitripennis]